MLGGAYSLTFLRSETATPAAATAAAPITPAIAVVSTPVCGEREEVSLEAAVPSDFSPTREMVSAFNEFSFVRQNLALKASQTCQERSIWRQMGPAAHQNGAESSNFAAQT